MASDQAKDLVVEICEILNPVMGVLEGDIALVYEKFDELAEFIDSLLENGA